MRGIDHQQGHIFSYLSPEERVRKDHPLRAVRAMTDAILHEMSPVFDSMYARRGRPSIPPEKLLRAQLLQMLYSVRSERLLMEEIDYSVLYPLVRGAEPGRRGVGCDQLHEEPRPAAGSGGGEGVPAQVVEQARGAGLISDEHFTVDGTLLEAWASLKSFQPKDGKDEHTAGRSRQSDGEFPRGASARTRRMSRRPIRMRSWRARAGQGGEAELQRQSAGGEPQRADRECGVAGSQRTGGARCGAADAGAGSGDEADHGGRRQGLRHGGVRCRVPSYERDAACGAKHGPARRQRHRCAHHAARRVTQSARRRESGSKNASAG